MKHFISTFFMCLLLSAPALYAQSEAAEEPDLEQLARVNTRQGVEVYIMSEPLRPYEVCGNIAVVDAGAWLKAANGDGDDRNLGKKVDALIQNANKRVRKKKIEPFDAIMTTNGETGVAIRFTD